MSLTDEILILVFATLFYLCDHWTVILRANRSNWILTVGCWCHSQQFVDFYTLKSFMLDLGPEFHTSVSFYLADAWPCTLSSRVWFAFAFAFALENVCRKLCGFAFVEVVKIGLWICVCGSWILFAVPITVFFAMDTIKFISLLFMQWKLMWFFKSF